MRKLAVNAVFLQPGMGGVETLTRELVPRMAECLPETKVVVHCNPAGADLLRGDSKPTNLEIVSHRLIGMRGVRAFGETLLLGPAALRDADALLSMAFTSPLVGSPPTSVFIHDLIWRQEQDLGDGDRVTPAVLGRLVPRVAHHAERVIALTRTGADELVEELGIDRGKIDVVSPGFEVREPVPPTPDGALRQALDLGDGPIVLGVAAMKAHKNLARLVEAMQVVLRRYPDARLVVPGPKTAYEAELRRIAQACGVEQTIRFPGYVDRADLEALYAGCACFVFPSTREGFGIPLLEAMARDAPIVCAEGSVPAEVAGDAALLVDPYSSTAIADGMLAVMNDPEVANRLVAHGRLRVREFTWDRAVKQTLGSLQRAVAVRRDGRA
jgi:glycosyltransferase involved in cell wall biosynthesis